MQFFLIVIAVCFFLFLFYLHVLSKEDFVFFRKNVSLESLFNVAFLTGFAALFTSRLFYVLFHPAMAFVNPLVFFGIPYFPGLSLSGALVGAVIFLYVYGRVRKAPVERIGDFFTLPVLLIAPLGLLSAAVLSGREEAVFFVLAACFTFFLFIFFAKFLFPKLSGGQYKDGTLSYLFLMNFPLVILLASIISRASLKKFYFTPEDVILFGLFLLGTTLYVRQEANSRKRRPAARL